MHKGINTSNINGTSNNTSLGLKFGTSQGKSYEHVFVPRATNTEPTFGFKISWNPVHVAHHISHVHVDVEFFEIQGENNQSLPRMSCGQAYKK